MASLIEKSPCEGLLPLSVLGAQLRELRPGPVTSIAPFKGKDRAVATALKAVGLGFPGPNRSLGAGDGLAIWSGHGQMFLAGVAPPAGLAAIAALTDQGDAWAVLRLEGEAAEAVLARLVAVDLRAAHFPPGQALRTGLNHMLALVRRAGADAFDIWVFRSMAASAVHELHIAMSALAARR